MGMSVREFARRRALSHIVAANRLEPK